MPRRSYPGHRRFPKGSGGRDWPEDPHTRGSGTAAHGALQRGCSALASSTPPAATQAVGGVGWARRPKGHRRLPPVLLDPASPRPLVLLTARFAADGLEAASGLRPHGETRLRPGVPNRNSNRAPPMHRSSPITHLDLTMRKRPSPARAPGGPRRRRRGSQALGRGLRGVASSFSVPVQVWASTWHRNGRLSSMSRCWIPPPPPSSSRSGRAGSTRPSAAVVCLTSRLAATSALFAATSSAGWRYSAFRPVDERAGASLGGP